MTTATYDDMARACPPTYTLNGAAFPKVTAGAAPLSTYSTAYANVPVLFRRIRPLPGQRSRASAQGRSGDKSGKPDFRPTPRDCLQNVNFARCSLRCRVLHLGDGL